MTENTVEPEEQPEDKPSDWSDLAPDGTEGAKTPESPELADDATAPGSLGGDNGGG